VTLANDIAASSGDPVSDEVRVIGAEDVLSEYRKSIAVVEDEQGRVVGTYVVRPPEPARRQEEFLAQVTHELKAPLSSICSGLEIVNRTGRHKLSAQEARFLDISLKNAEQLRQTVSELLDFSKLESGRMQVKLVPTRVEHLVREAVEGMRPWAALKGLTLSETPLDELSRTMVLGDPVRIVQMLTNLISNAIKSTPAPGAITVSAALGRGADSGGVVFSVRDTGCGVAPADRERIFESFIQAVGDGQRRDGVGLGLTIVKEMVERHHGRLWLDSEAGRGSTFFFSIPLAEASHIPSTKESRSVHGQ
jgi:signal transduction histidine kinase